VTPELAARLAHDRALWLTTLRPDGSPHTTPVWFVHDEGTFWICCAAGNVKVANVLDDGRVSLALPDPDAPAVAQGTAQTLRSGFPEEVVRAFAHRYGWDVEAGANVLLRVPVERWLLDGRATSR